MNKSLLALGAGLILVLSSPVPCAQAAGTVQLSGHVLPFVSQLQARGHLAATNLNLAIGLPLRNREALTNLLEQINDPASTNYHKYLTPAQFNDKFAPSASDYQAVADFAQQHGLKVVGTHGNRMLLDVRGLSTDIEKTFQVNFKTYKHPTENRQFFATDVEPTVPAGLPVLDISGLNNYTRPHAHLLYKSITPGSNAVVKSSGKASPNAGSGPVGTYMGNDFRNAYIPGSTLMGSGQTIALVEYDGYFLSDIQAYEAQAGRTNIPLQNILIDGFNGAPTFIDGNSEVSLDIEMLVSMAPAAAQINVYEGSPFSSTPNDVINRIATDDSANQISTSWTWSGGPSATADQIYQQFILQGQSYFQCSSDFDAYVAGTVDNPNYFGTPADSPYVTSVGGTTLTMTPNGASRVSETVWNWDVEYGPVYDGVGSSGGISTYYTIPSWQTNVNMAACQGSTTHRNFPDVALTADNIYVIYFGGLEGSFGGTSAATPLWAAFTSLINQQETNYSHAPIGFINPALYAIANSANYTNCFNDITTGSNTWSASPSLFIAVTNYDLCTGLGTPNGTNLINALVTNPVTNYVFKLSAPPAPYGSTLSTLNGGTPNGAWNLFIQDDNQFNTGLISNGWAINLTLGSPLGSVADLGLTLIASATTVAPGGKVGFSFTVTNYGGFSTATNVLVQNTLTSGTSLISSNLSTGTLVRSGDEFVWSVGNLATNAGATLSIVVQAPSVAGNIICAATALSDTPDPNPADSSVNVSVAVASTTAPTLSTSYNAASGHFVLSVGGTGTVRVDDSTNLANSADWVPVLTNTAPFSYTNYNSWANHQFFFRAVTATSP